MSYGLSVFKSNGSVGFSTADVTWQTLDQFTVNANATVSNTYSEASGMTIIAQRQLVNVPPNSQEDYVPNVTISGTTVTVSPQSGVSSSKCIVHILAQDT
ncbi:hypothetical protein N9Z55_06670 [Akkermansiaceae bacterium]|nr:hypothetical protein [Akkermansiaceae bacterium]